MVKLATPMQCVPRDSVTKQTVVVSVELKIQFQMGIFVIRIPIVKVVTVNHGFSLVPFVRINRNFHLDYNCSSCSMQCRLDNNTLAEWKTDFCNFVLPTFELSQTAIYNAPSKDLVLIK